AGVDMPGIVLCRGPRSKVSSSLFSPLPPLTAYPDTDIITLSHTGDRRMGKAKPPPAVSEALRGAIRDSGQTLYRVSKGSGVAYAALHRFIAGKRSVSLEAFDKLCAYLGLTLTPKGDKRQA